MPAFGKLHVAALAIILCGTGATTASATGSVQGFVFAQNTNQALAGVAISVDSNCIGFDDGYCFSNSVAISAGDGSFTESGVVAGNAYVSASFASPSQYLPIHRQQVIVSDGSATQVALHMQLGAVITGMVTRAMDGAPVVDVPIHLENLNGNGSVFETTSDAYGIYTFAPLPAGSYSASTVGAPPYQGQFYAGHPVTPPSQNNQGLDPITVNPGETAAGKNFSLVEGGHIRGKLTDRYTGLSIASVDSFYFNIYDAGNPNNGQWLTLGTSTDAQGNYELTGLPNAPIYLATGYQGPYLASVFGCTPDPCDFANATALSAPAGTILNNIDISIFPGAVVSGTVSRRSDGAPVPNATVTGYFNLNLGGLAEAATTQTDAQGRYTMTGCILCRYVEVSNAFVGGSAYIGQDYNDHNCQQGKCATLSGNSVMPPQYTAMSGIDFHLDPGAVITGQVVRSDIGTGLHAYVDLYASDGSFSSALSTDPNGQFVTAALQPGTYYLAAFPDFASGYDCQIYSGVLCGQGIDVTLVGQPIVIAGTQDVTGILIELPNDTLFGNGFE
jgi:Carboxypeptidase regulatory-like domain